MTKGDTVNFHLETVRISRGVNGVSGWVEIFKDIEKDDLIFEGYVSYHTMLSDTYMKTPFTIPKTNMLDGMNVYYHDYIDATNECVVTKNAPTFDKFEFPLTARRVEFRNCIMTTKNLPRHLKPGMYKIYATSVGIMEASFEVIFKAVR